MGCTIVAEPKHFEKDGSPVVSASIEIDGNGYEVWYRVSEGPLNTRADTFLVATLVPAMRVGDPLRIDGTVSSRLLENISKVQEILHCWDRRLQKVSIEAKSAAEEPSPQGVGCFFSGGVDSFYSLLKHYDEITKMIFVHGFDIRLDDRPLRTRVSQAIREIAAELEKPLVEVETNLREFADDFVEWGAHYFGAALASVALLLSPQIRKVFIAAPRSYSHLHPWGSHPLLDPLWSTANTEIVHNGCEAARVEKVAQIALCDTALRWLRVCWENRDGAYNCGQCEKCVRTMVSLRAAAALEHCATFDRPLDLVVVSRMPISDLNARIFVEENLRAVEQRGEDPALAQALRDCLRQATPPSKEEVDLLSEQLQEREAEIATLKALVAGYESGRVMRVLNAAERFRQRIINRVSRGTRI